MSTKTALTVEDALTGEWFPADWLISRNMHTSPYLAEQHIIDKLQVPLTSFLAEVIEENWRNNWDWKSNYLREYGYPVKITFHPGNQTVVWLCLLVRPSSHAIQGDVFMLCQIGVEEVTPLQFSVSLEEWREMKEKTNAKSQKSSEVA